MEAYGPRSLLRHMWLAAVMIAACCIMSALSSFAIAEVGDSSPPDLSSLSIEDLMNLQVTSVSKKAERVSESAAAVYVITQEDIRRSGVTTIADALRMAPGLHVASISSHIWAISARGFNDRFANKMLVLMDGRSVYTPLFAGTSWDAQDTLLEDIDRIEVIRGPGATMWGSNAVNGVINIITKKTVETQGMLMTSETGSPNRYAGSLRYGGSIGGNSHFRMYAKHMDRTPFIKVSGEDAGDSWNQSRAGFRMDRDHSNGDSLTINGNTYSGAGSQESGGVLLVPPYNASVVRDYDYAGTNLLARWTHSGMNGSEMALQLYADRTERHDGQHSEKRDTWDLDFQSSVSPSDRRELMWGLGYRVTSDHLGSTPYALFEPDSRTDSLLNAFIQEEITLIDRKLRLTVGSKFEHNDYTGFEIQPNVRMLWTPNERNTVWTAVSRAVRIPTRAEDDAVFTFNVLPPGSLPMPPGTPLLPIAIVFVSNDQIKSETVISYELGYRFQPADRLSFDVATFYSFYDDLRTLQPGSPYVQMTPSPHIVVPYQFTNMAAARSYGVELAANWEAARSWKLALGLTWTDVHVTLDPGSGDPFLASYNKHSPYQAGLRSYLDLKNNLSLDIGLYYVDYMLGYADRAPSYIRADARLGWRGPNGTDASLVFQNMFSSGHLEFGSTLWELPSEVPSTVYLKLTKRY